MGRSRYLYTRLRIPRRQPYADVLSILEEMSGRERAEWIREAVLEKALRSGAAFTGAGLKDYGVSPVPAAPQAGSPQTVSREMPFNEPQAVPPAAAPPAPEVSPAPVGAVAAADGEGESEDVPLDEIDREALSRLGGLVAAV